MFFDHNNIPPGTTNYGWCPFGSIFGQSLCVTENTDGTNSNMTFNAATYTFSPGVFSLSSITTDGSGHVVGQTYSHVPTKIAPDFGTDVLPSLTLNAPTGSGSSLYSLISTGNMRFNGLGSGTCAFALALDASNNVIPVGCGGGSGPTVQVNGSSTGLTSTVNLNGTTPAAPTNGINATWAGSGSSVSAAIVAAGNASHLLHGQGGW